VASLIALLPLLSVPDAGGPVMPERTVNEELRVRSDEVVTGAASGFVHPTGTWLPSTVTVGWPSALLHSDMPPGLPAKRPLAVTVTT
jgi:hypothetical protein